MIQPLVQIVEALLRVDPVDQNSDLNVAHEQMCQVVNVSVASCIPDVQLDAVLAAIDGDFDNPAEVRDHGRHFRGVIALCFSLHKRLDDTSLAHGRIAHEYNLGVDDLIIFTRLLPRILILSTRVTATVRREFHIDLSSGSTSLRPAATATTFSILST